MNLLKKNVIAHILDKIKLILY